MCRYPSIYMVYTYLHMLSVWWSSVHTYVRDPSCFGCTRTDIDVRTSLRIDLKKFIWVIIFPGDIHTSVYMYMDACLAAGIVVYLRDGDKKLFERKRKSTSYKQHAQHLSICVERGRREEEKEEPAEFLCVLEFAGASAEMIESAIGMVVSHYTPWRSIRAGKQLSDSKGSSAALSTEAAILSIKRGIYTDLYMYVRVCVCGCVRVRAWT